MTQNKLLLASHAHKATLDSFFFHRTGLAKGRLLFHLISWLTLHFGKNKCCTAAHKKSQRVPAENQAAANLKCPCECVHSTECICCVCTFLRLLSPTSQGTSWSSLFPDHLLSSSITWSHTGIHTRVPTVWYTSHTHTHSDAELWSITKGTHPFPDKGVCTCV